MRVVSNIGAEYIVHDLVQNKDIPVHVTRMKVFEHVLLAYPGMCIRTNVILRRLINMALFVDYKQLDLF